MITQYYSSSLSSYRPISHSQPHYTIVLPLSSLLFSFLASSFSLPESLPPPHVYAQRTMSFLLLPQGAPHSPSSSFPTRKVKFSPFSRIFFYFLFCLCPVGRFPPLRIPFFFFFRRKRRRRRRRKWSNLHQKKKRKRKKSHVLTPHHSPEDERRPLDPTLRAVARLASPSGKGQIKSHFRKSIFGQYLNTYLREANARKRMRIVEDFAS